MITLGSGPVRGVGVDAVDVSRFAESLTRTPSMRARLFVDEELDYLAARVNQVEGLAARFAAREAAMKAMGLGLGAFGFHDVFVRVVAGSGQPALVVRDRAADLAAERGIVSWHLSLTHTDAMAIAVVVASGAS